MKRIQPSAFLYLLLLANIGLATTQCTNGTIPEILPVDESYHPAKPIEFPHAIHTEKGIDCKYCHNPGENGEKPGIATLNTCINCHKEITGDQTRDSTKN